MCIKCSFRTLGLDPDSKPSFKEIRTAYLALALANHPEKNKNPNAHLAFIIQDAYNRLSDHKSRELYEQTNTCNHGCTTYKHETPEDKRETNTNTSARANAPAITLAKSKPPF